MSTALAQDERHMRRALDLARDTAALASPNPQVGCVLVDAHGEVLGEGAHLYRNRDHAEIVALKQAAAHNRSTQGATAYVTLEPCSHHGRTGPCADALIGAGIRRAVIATEDPNPLVRGEGIAKLRSAGIEVALGVCQQPARDLNDAFAHFIHTHLPFVTLKAALSSDGKLAPSPEHRPPNWPFWLTGPAARAEVQLLRHSSDAILTGIGTVLADDPALTDRTALPRRRPLLRVVLDTHLRTPPGSQLVRSAQSDLLILGGADVDPNRRAVLEDLGVEIQSLAETGGRLDLASVLGALANRDCTSLLLECGSALNGACLQQDLVDRIVLFTAPRSLGELALPFATGVASPGEVEARLSRISRQTIGPDTMLTGLVHDPWRLSRTSAPHEQTTETTEL